MFIRTAEAICDPVDYVRHEAINALSKLFPDCHRGSNTDANFRARLVEVLVRLCDSDPERHRFLMVKQLIILYGDSLTSDDMERLMPPLINAWESQRHNRFSVSYGKTKGRT